jgi:hypothetical protein
MREVFSPEARANLALRTRRRWRRKPRKIRRADRNRQHFAKPANAPDDPSGSFPGRESFEAFVAPSMHIAGLRVHPKIKQFGLGEMDEGLVWLETGP